VDQLLKMEVSIIQTLRWRLNPPTPYIYLDVANPIIDASAIDAQDSYEIAELSRYLVELSVCDGYFNDKKPSSIAYASILIAMENLSMSAKIEIEMRLGSYQLDKSPHLTELCVQRLRQVYRLALSPQSEEEEGEFGRAGVSPTSVFQEYS